MTVSALSTNATGRYVYGIQELQVYNSTLVYRRKINTDSTADVWTFGKWETDLGAIVDTFGTNGWTDVENSYFTPGSGIKVVKQGGIAMLYINGTISATSPDWSNIGRVEKATETLTINVLANNGQLVRLRVLNSGYVQMSYRGEVPTVIGTTIMFPIAVT